MSRKKEINSANLTQAFKPQTVNQNNYVRTVCECDVSFVSGPAGCGKTYLATGLASSWLLENKFSTIVVVRPAIEACGKNGKQNLGYLPGGIEDKISPYLQPTINYLQMFLGSDRYHKLFHENVIQFHAMEYCRGMTWDNTILLGEEFQSANTEQIKMIVSRLGRNSKAILSGDPEQSDVKRTNSEFETDFEYVMNKVENADLEEFGIVKLTDVDILRNDFIAKFLKVLR